MESVETPIYIYRGPGPGSRAQGLGPGAQARGPQWAPSIAGAVCYGPFQEQTQLDYHLVSHYSAEPFVLIECAEALVGRTAFPATNHGRASRPLIRTPPRGPGALQPSAKLAHPLRN